MRQRLGQRWFGWAVFLVAGVSASVLMSALGTLYGAEQSRADEPQAAFQPLFLTAAEMAPASGVPSLTSMNAKGGSVPIWSLSGRTVGQSVSGVIPTLPAGCAGVKVEIVVLNEHPETSAAMEDAYRVHLAQVDVPQGKLVRSVSTQPVRSRLASEPGLFRTITLESWYSVEPGLPLVVRVQREPDDPADTFPHPAGLFLVKVTPLPPLPESRVVQDAPGYNSWPVIQALGDKLVCVYSKGTAHSIDEGVRGVFARTSSDHGKTWGPEVLVANDPNCGEVTIGKGLDENGAVLIWVRRVSREGFSHALYRTTDGEAFELISVPPLEVMPMQITDVFHVPTVGLVALWFEGNYGSNGPCHSWGMVVSKDNGATWTQTVIERELPENQWPTEPSAVYLGEGRILVLARSELGDRTTARCQFQLTSTDYGKTWHRSQTNIGEVLASTPSLILDADTGLLSCYYYERGRGVLRRRVVKPEAIFSEPFQWPASEAVVLGSDKTYHAGNVNAVAIGRRHFLAFYSGDEKNTAVVVAEVPAP